MKVVERGCDGHCGNETGCWKSTLSEKCCCNEKNFCNAKHTSPFVKCKKDPGSVRETCEASMCYIIESGDVTMKGCAIGDHCKKVGCKSEAMGKQTTCCCNHTDYCNKDFETAQNGTEIIDQGSGSSPKEKMNTKATKTTTKRKNPQTKKKGAGTESKEHPGTIEWRDGINGKCYALKSCSKQKTSSKPKTIYRMCASVQCKDGKSGCSTTYAPSYWSTVCCCRHNLCNGGGVKKGDPLLCYSTGAQSSCVAEKSSSSRSSRYSGTQMSCDDLDCAKQVGCKAQSDGSTLCCCYENYCNSGRARQQSDSMAVRSIQSTYLQLIVFVPLFTKATLAHIF